MRTIHPNTTITNYPFGMRTKTTNFQFGSFRSPEKHDSGLMLGRTYTSEAYSWGFNGKEKDDEVSGSGNNLNFGARIYDSRLGRWFALDPLQTNYSSLSPYNFVGNSPLCSFDPDGNRIIIKSKVDQVEAQKYFSELGLTGAFRFDKQGRLKVNRKWERKNKEFLNNADMNSVFSGIKELSKDKNDNVNVQFFESDKWVIKRTEFIFEESYGTEEDGTRNNVTNKDLNGAKWEKFTKVTEFEITIEGKNSQFIYGRNASDVVMNKNVTVDYASESGGMVESKQSSTFIHLLLDRGLNGDNSSVKYENNARNILGTDRRSGKDFRKEEDYKQTKVEEK